MNFLVLFNPLSGNIKNTDIRAELSAHLPDDELEFVDVTTISELEKYLSDAPADKTLLLAGGDGTLNRFINDSGAMLGKHSVYYYAAGNGNDFWSDIGHKRGDKPQCIDEYLKDLPIVTVNGKTSKFINGIGYGIDGYCCEVGDRLRAEGKKVNYTSIAVKGLLGGYKPCDAQITVKEKCADNGEVGTREKKFMFKKVWIAPTMLGKYYGGGMIPTPNQNRYDKKHNLSICVMHKHGKLKTLMNFPNIFKGTHTKSKKSVWINSGNEITVRFPRPSALQIDGETVLNVSEYTAKWGD